MPEVQVFMATGRTVEQKKQLMKDISDAVVRNTGAPLYAVTVQIIEAAMTDKMKGGATFAEWKKSPVKNNESVEASD